MNKFTLGALAGMSSLAIAVPLIVQGVSAATPTTSSSSSITSTAIPKHVFTPPTQACLTAEVALDQARIDNFDTMTAQRKTELQKHHDALATIAAITDDTQRADALTKLRADEMAAHKTDESNLPAAITTAQAAVKAACGNMMKPGFAGQEFGGMRGHKGMKMMGRPGFGAPDMDSDADNGGVPPTTSGGQ